MGTIAPTPIAPKPVKVARKNSGIANAPRRTLPNIDEDNIDASSCVDKSFSVVFSCLKITGSFESFFVVINSVIIFLLGVRLLKILPILSGVNRCTRSSTSFFFDKVCLVSFNMLKWSDLILFSAAGEQQCACAHRYEFLRHAALLFFVCSRFLRVFLVFLGSSSFLSLITKGMRSCPLMSVIVNCSGNSRAKSNAVSSLSGSTVSVDNIFRLISFDRCTLNWVASLTVFPVMPTITGVPTKISNKNNSSTDNPVQQEGPWRARSTTTAVKTGITNVHAIILPITLDANWSKISFDESTCNVVFFWSKMTGEFVPFLIVNAKRTIRLFRLRLLNNS